MRWRYQYHPLDRPGNYDVLTLATSFPTVWVAIMKELMPGTGWRTKSVNMDHLVLDIVICFSATHLVYVGRFYLIYPYQDMVVVRSPSLTNTTPANLKWRSWNQSPKVGRFLPHSKNPVITHLGNKINNFTIIMNRVYRQSTWLLYMCRQQQWGPKTGSSESPVNNLESPIDVTGGRRRHCPYTEWSIPHQEGLDVLSTRITWPFPLDLINRFYWCPGLA